MTTLGPNCDPDLSVTGAPWGGGPGGTNPGVLSTVLLLAVLTASLLLVAGSNGPGVGSVVTGGVALVSGAVLLRRAVRGVRRALSTFPVPAGRSATSPRRA